MKKDITIPKVHDVHIALVKENKSGQQDSGWMVYIINDLSDDLNLVIIVSQGFSDTKRTSTLRKRIDSLPKKSFAKIEIFTDELFTFTNEFKVSFFRNDKLYDKTFKFKPDSISKENLSNLPLIKQKGILAG